MKVCFLIFYICIVPIYVFECGVLFVPGILEGLRLTNNYLTVNVGDISHAIHTRYKCVTTDSSIFQYIFHALQRVTRYNIL